jgi:hypothetical protein
METTMRATMPDIFLLLAVGGNATAADNGVYSAGLSAK